MENNIDDIPMLEKVDIEVLHNEITQQRICLLYINDHPFKLDYDLAKYYLENDLPLKLKNELEHFIKMCKENN